MAGALSIRSLLFCLFSFSRVQHVFAVKACFNGDGNQVMSALPCNPDSEKDGPCCDLGFICLSNGLCSPGPNVKNHGYVDTYRPYCTDQAWSNSTECFSGCNQFEGNGLKNCNNEYCCYNMNGCSCSKTSLFDLGPYKFVTTLPLTMPTPSSTPTSTPASTTAATTATHSPTGTSSPGQKKEDSSSNSTAIGAGVGVGVGVPLLAAIAFLFWYMTRQKNKKSSPPYADTPFMTGDVKAPNQEQGAYQSMPQNNSVYAHHAPPPHHSYQPAPMSGEAQYPSYGTHEIGTSPQNVVEMDGGHQH